MDEFQESLKKYELRGIVIKEGEITKSSYAVVKELEFHGLKCSGKKINPNFYNQASPIERNNIEKKLVYECKVLSSLRHPNIVQFMGLGFDNLRLPIIVTEYLPCTLSAHLEKHGVLPLHISYSILDDVATGLCYLHEYQPHPITHSALTANNILLTEQLGAKISYFVEPKILGLKLPLSKPQVPACTETGATSLSQEHNMDSGLKIDSFSFGVLMIHVFSGKLPISVVQPNLGEIEFMLQQMDEMHSLKKLAKQCLCVEMVTPPKAADILSEIRKVSEGCIVEASVAQEGASLEEWQELMSAVHRLQSDKQAMIQEQRQTAGMMNHFTAFRTEIESMELSKLRIRNAHMAERIQMLSDDLDAKQLTIESKNKMLRELVDAKEKQEDALLNLQIKKSELSLRDKIISSNEKELEKLAHLFTAISTDMPHPLNMKYRLSWREAAEVPFGMSAPQHVVIGSKLYMGGGQTDANNSKHIIMCYCTESNTWDLLPPSPFIHFGLGRHEGKLVTVGGSFEDNNDTVTGDVMYFNNDRREWTKCIDPMPTPRRRSCVVSYKLGLAVCGGIEKNGKVSAVVEVFSQQQWQAACTMPNPRAALGVSVKGDTAYFSRGYYPDLQSWKDAKNECLFVNLAALFKLQSTEWYTLAPLPVTCTMAISHCGTLMTIGGVDAHSSNFTNVCRAYAYNPRLGSWIHIDELNFECSSMTVASMFNNDIIIVGGWVDGKRSKCVKIGTYEQSLAKSF